MSDGVKGMQLGNTLDIGDEAHVEHAVGFVDDEDFDGAHQKLAALEMVQQAAGRADQNVCTALELAVLVFEGNAADQQRDVQAVVLAVFFEVLRDLRGEFARRFEDQRSWHAGAGAALFQQRQHRQIRRMPSCLFLSARSRKCHGAAGRTGLLLPE